MPLPAFQSLLQLLAAFPDEQACRSYLEQVRWPNGVVSPYNATSTVYRCKIGQYKCRSTNRYFNVLTRTVFEDTKVPLRKWFIAIYLVTAHKKGVSSCQLARDLGVTQKSAWYMLKRIQLCLATDCVECLSSEVEVDETYIGGKEKNKHRSKKTEGARGRSIKGKVPVLGMVQRGGMVVAHAVKDTQAHTLLPHIYRSVQTSTTVYTDEWAAYRPLSNSSYIHSFVLHGAGQYVSGKAHTNTIEGYWSHLKRMLLGVHHHVSRKHLQHYVNSQTFRYNTRDYSENQRFTLLLQNAGHRITYQTLVRPTPHR